MAITPEQASKLSEEEQAEVRRLEQAVDALLQVEFAEKEYFIEVSKLGFTESKPIPNRIFLGLRRKYGQAGWVLDQVSKSKEDVVGYNGDDASDPIRKEVTVHLLHFRVKC